VFGSVIKGLSTGASDVDILIISDQLPKKCKDRGNLKANIEERAAPTPIPPLQNTFSNKRRSR